LRHERGRSKVGRKMPEDVFVVPRIVWPRMSTAMPATFARTELKKCEEMTSFVDTKAAPDALAGFFLLSIHPRPVDMERFDHRLGAEDRLFTRP